ncbi:hypothetical protein WN51_07126 [Melipona quadrifasciata]|uniref:Uncharacterized protein n=1 Tax=Melipona quadrifasciata TaxID=166423 RepID=A0A0N0BC43_9HYME|nr:hypothetical protein WN51_07126 [Melipona quadrifasciata]
MSSGTGGGVYISSVPLLAAGHVAGVEGWGKRRTPYPYTGIRTVMFVFTPGHERRYGRPFVADASLVREGSIRHDPGRGGPDRSVPDNATPTRGLPHASHESRDPNQPIANFRCISVAPEEARFSELPPLKSLSICSGLAPRIPQVRVSNTRLAEAASGYAPSVDVLPIFDVKQQSVRNPARMGANQPTSRFSYNNKRLE